MQIQFLLNVGNTHSELARYRRGAVEQRLHCPSDRLLGNATLVSELGKKEVTCLAACVRSDIRKMLQDRYEQTIRWLDATMSLGVDFSRVDTMGLGTDRVANAVAAVHELDLPVIILDCGTAITTEVIDGDKRFLGGAILPGRQLMRQALANGTTRLPLSSLSDGRIPSIGKNTHSAVAAGVDLGVLGAVDRLITQTRHSLAKKMDVRVVVIGGDRHYFFRQLLTDLNDMEEGPADFTLRGLAWCTKVLLEYE